MMKRLLYPVVMCLVAFTAFGHSTQQITHDEDQYAAYQTLSPEAAKVIDSLSIALGDVYGIGIGQQLHGIPDADIDIAQVTKTINQIVNCPEGKDFISGMKMGLMSTQLFQDFKNNHGCDLNKQLLLEHLKAELFTENPLDETATHALGERISDLFEQLKSNGEGPNDALIDSISSTIGTVNGSQIRNSLGMTDTGLEQFFKGFEYGFEQEVDNISLAYEQAGIQIFQALDYFQEQTHIPLNKDLLMEHLFSGLSVETIDEEEILTLQHQIEPLMARAIELSPESIANKKAGEAYMEQLRKDKSFKFTKSGLAYKMLKKGKGKKFTKDDVVNTIYVGKHLDGTVFDSSEGEPMPFSSDLVIPGFSEMLQLMKPGSKAIVVIPSNLAYGASGAGGLIGPNETLIFEIETVDREK